MSAKHWTTVAMAALVGGCIEDLRPASRTDVRVGDEILVSNAASGERCRVRKVKDDGSRLMIEDFVIQCDGWQSEAGRLRRFRMSRSQTLEPLLERDDLAPWDAGKVRCQPAESTESATGKPAWTRACVTVEGWPAMAWAMRTEVDGIPAALVGFGLPHLAPIVEELAAGVGELEVKRAGTRSPLVKLADAQSRGTASLADIMDHAKLLRLAATYNHLGDFSSAAAAIERALVLQKSASGGESPYLATTYAELGLNLASDGKDEEAQRIFDRAEPLARRIAWSDAYDLYASYRAVHESRGGRLERALDYARESSEGRMARYGRDSAALAHARVIEAGILKDLGRVDEARNLVSHVVSIHERSRDYAGLAFAYARLGEIERAGGDLDAADLAMAEAERLVRLLFGDGPNLAMIRALRASIAMERGDRAAALAAFADMITIAEAMRREGRHLAGNDVGAYLDLLLDGEAIGPGALAEAFKAAQLARGTVVDKAMRQMTARLASGDREVAALVRQLQDTRQRGRHVRQTLGERRLDAATDGTADPGITLLEQELAQIEAEVEGLERQVQQRFPRFGALAAPALVEAADAAALLAPGEGLLRFVVTDAATYAILLLDDGTLHAHRAEAGRDALAGRVTDLRRALTFAEGLRPFDIEAAHALYRDLIGDLDGVLAARRHVAVVADGALASLPPALLVRAPAESYAETAWLGQDTALSMISSVEAFVAMRRDLRPSQARHAFLGIGDPVLAGSGGTHAAISRAAEACREGGELDPLLLKALPSLPETADELVMVSEALGGDSNLIKTGDEATEAAVRELPLADYRVISFATHGLLPGELPCNAEPALVMTPPVDGQGDDNGLLDASEIATLDLDADWVVLSACNTAGPDGELGGEALSGLARAFIHAGARSMLVSHWDVASDSTVRLMRHTFETYDQSIGAGSRALALQQAQLSMMTDPSLAHPAFWAAFTLIGDSGALPETAAGPLASSGS